MLSAFGAGTLMADDTMEESRVKAAFVFNFMKFTEWPDGGGPAPATIDLCIAGGQSLGGQIDALANRSVGRRSVRIVPWNPAAEPPGCDVAFLGASDPATLRSLKQASARRPVLTIGDQPGFVDRGGMIELKIIDGRVRFDINLATARAANLKLSSQLLQLADRVTQ